MRLIEGEIRGHYETYKMRQWAIMRWY